MLTATATTGTATEPDRSTLAGWLSVVAVMTGIFSIVTTEILPIGLLTSIGSAFGVSDGTAGLMMTMPGLLAAVAAPTVTVVTARLDRRTLLCAFMVLLVVADLLAALATAYWVMLVSRILVGITIGGFWSVGAGLADRLVRRESVARATAVIFSAVPLGSVAGVPAGTLIGALAGWRAAFAVMAALTTCVLVVLIVSMPPMPPVRATRLSVLRGTLRSSGTRVALLVTFLIVFAHFGTYTYVRPFLQQVTHVSSRSITAFLLVYGAAGIIGNFVGGALVARHPRATFGAAGAMLAAATLLLPLLGRWDAGAIALLVVWGVAYGAVPVSSQAWFSRGAPQAPEAASVVFTAAFQATISAGALAGGVVVDRTSPSAVMAFGGVTAVLMVLTVGTPAVGRRRSGRRARTT